MSMSSMLALSISSAAALLILVFYLPVRLKIMGISFSPRLTATWFIPLVDVAVTLYLIAGNWFGLTKTTGIMMTMSATATAIGLSMCAFVIRKFLGPKWKRQYINQRRGK